MDEFWNFDCHEGVVDSVTAEDVSKAAYDVAESIFSIQDREKSRETSSMKRSQKMSHDSTGSKNGKHDSVKTYLLPQAESSLQG